MTKLANWDAKPQYMYYHGETREFFLKSALAKALNREIQSIYAMERRGVLCLPRLKNHRGRWLYTREQINDIVRLAKEEKVIDPRFRNPFSERFVREAHIIIRRKP